MSHVDALIDIMLEALQDHCGSYCITRRSKIVRSIRPSFRVVRMELTSRADAFAELHARIRGTASSRLEASMASHSRWVLDTITSRVVRSVDLRKYANNESLSSLSFVETVWTSEIKRCTTDIIQQGLLLEAIRQIYSVRPNSLGPSAICRT